MKKERGISLITLIISVVVVLIVVVAVLLSIAFNNPIEKSGEAKFKKSVEGYKSELTLAISNQYFKDYLFNPATFNAGPWDGNKDNIEDTIKKYITSITPEHGKKFEIQAGQLVYIGESDEEKLWLLEIGCYKEKIVEEVDIYDDTKDVEAAENEIQDENEDQNE